MRPFRLLLIILLAAPLAAAQSDDPAEPAPQQDWMVHMDGGDGAWRYVPDRLVLVPGGLVQLMIFGNGQFSLTLDDDPTRDADIATTTGTVRTAEFRAPDEPGDYPFHDKYHPEARGVLLVRAAGGAPAAGPASSEDGARVGVVPGGYESRFAPERLEVAPGQEVTFEANGSFGHNLRSVEEGLFTAGDLKPGESATFTAPTAAGEYAFECRFHAEQGMKGTLVVRPPEPGSAPAESQETPRDAETPWPAAAALLALAGVALLVGRARR